MAPGERRLRLLQLPLLRLATRQGRPPVQPVHLESLRQHQPAPPVGWFAKRVAPR